MENKTFMLDGEEIDVKKMYRWELDEALEKTAKKMNTSGNTAELKEMCSAIAHEINLRSKSKGLDNNFLVGIVDNIDEWLEDKGIRIPNEDRDDEDPDNHANFYGEDFDWIMDMLREECRQHGIIVEDCWE